MRANLACFAFACGSAVDVRASLPTRQTRQTSMSTARGSTEGSEPRTRGRTRPRLLVGEKESSRCGNRSATYSSSSSCLSPQSGGGCLAMCRAPYMDVQTVKTNLTADQAAMLEVKLNFYKGNGISPRHRVSSCVRCVLLKRMPWIRFEQRRTASLCID